jgi:hypothetical protein
MKLLANKKTANYQGDREVHNTVAKCEVEVLKNYVQEGSAKQCTYRWYGTEHSV